mgnify:CR=1 FL=1
MRTDNTGSSQPPRAPKPKAPTLANKFKLTIPGDKNTVPYAIYGDTLDDIVRQYNERREPVYTGTAVRGAK